MRWLIALAVLALLLLLAALPACDTINVGDGVARLDGIEGPISITVPTGLAYTYNGTFVASWFGNVKTITWDFGGGADPNTIGPISATSPDSQTVFMSDYRGGTFNVSVTLTDAIGRTYTASSSYSYRPLPIEPAILSISGGDGTNAISVHGDDPDGDDIVVTATPPPGITTDGPQTITGGSGDVTFHFVADDFFAGGSGSASFMGNDGFNETNTVSANVVCPSITLAADTLYAIPMVPTAAPGDTVTVVVATGVPASPFQFMNGCRVTAPTGFLYVAGTFNPGVTGGGAGGVDGYWTGMNPAGGFLLPPESFIIETDLGGGVTGIDFNATPVGGSDRTTDEGALFNFGATFAAGHNTLGFQDVSGVSRTYYTDSNAAPDRFWGDITNNHAGIPNSVEVE